MIAGGAKLAEVARWVFGLSTIAFGLGHFANVGSVAAFSVVALAPLPFSAPHAHAAWGVNVYNLAAVGAALVFAGWLARQTEPPSRRT